MNTQLEAVAKFAKFAAADPAVTGARVVVRMDSGRPVVLDLTYDRFTTAVRAHYVRHALVADLPADASVGDYAAASLQEAAA